METTGLVIWQDIRDYLDQCLISNLSKDDKHLIPAFQLCVLLFNIQLSISSASVTPLACFCFPVQDFFSF